MRIVEHRTGPAIGPIGTGQARWGAFETGGDTHDPGGGSLDERTIAVIRHMTDSEGRVTHSGEHPALVTGEHAAIVVVGELSDSATALATAMVPPAKGLISNTPMGPFQKIVFAALTFSSKRVTVSGPISRPIWLPGIFSE